MLRSKVKGTAKIFLSRDGVKLYYDLQGSGESTLVFIHGWLMNADIWKYQVGEFASEYQTLAIDLRGFGRSDKPDVQYTFALFADDLHWLLGELQIENPILVGWSKGVSIALVYASTYLDQISGLVLVDGGPKFINSDDFQHGIEQATFDELISQFEDDYETSARSFIDFCLPESDDESLKSWLFSLTRQTPLSVAMNSIKNDALEDLRPLLKDISVKTLICCGTEDTICPPEASQALKAELPDAELHMFEGLGHAPFLTDPLTLNSRLRKFFDGIAR